MWATLQAGRDRAEGAQEGSEEVCHGMIMPLASLCGQLAQYGYAGGRGGHAKSGQMRGALPK
jgi:hypothetical protein